LFLRGEGGVQFRMHLDKVINYVLHFYQNISYVCDHLFSLESAFRIQANITSTVFLLWMLSLGENISDGPG
jgi:hypothetical protein